MSGVADTDVLVVGGGPVGLAAAIGAREAGLAVLVVEHRAGTLDKACGEGLLPGALRAVRSLGVDPEGYPLTGISYRRPGRHADHLFTDGPGRGVRRTVLHAALSRRAAAAGASVVQGRVRSLRQDATGVTVEVAGRTAVQTLRARWLLGCDGLHSTVRRLAGLEAGSPPRVPGAGSGRYGLRRHYRVAPWSDLVEVHWGRRAEAYVTPVAPDVVGVAVLGPRRSTASVSGGAGDGFERAVAASFPELAERLRDRPPLGPVRGAGPLRQTSRRRALGWVRLVGDASGYVDALTGEGLRVGVAQAEAAVRCLDDPDGYERAWRSVTRDYRLLTSGLVMWASGPARGAIVPLAAASPGLYGAVVERLAR